MGIEIAYIEQSKKVWENMIMNTKNLKYNY
jgi:hypothetical protein